MKNTGKSVALGALVGTLTRLVVGAVVAGLAIGWPESHMLALGDVPTVAAYLLLGTLGFERCISGAFDPVFLVMGLAVWALLGGFVGLFSAHLWRSRARE